MRKTLLALGSGVGVLASALLLPLEASTAASTPDACKSLTTPVYQQEAPNRSLLTTSKTEADGATKYGFNTAKGEVFKASPKAVSGLTAVHRLYNAKSTDFVWLAESNELNTAISKYGYTDQGTKFYAFTTAQSCTTPVYRMEKGAMHKFATTKAEVDALSKAGWLGPKLTFHVGPATTVAPPTTQPPTTQPPTTQPPTTQPPTTQPPTTQPPTAQPPTTQPPADDGKFSVMVYPDTQNESVEGVNGRMTKRSNWVVAEKAARDIRFVAHTGDLVNWGWLVPAQYESAKAGMKPLQNADLPYSISVGNHDTRAVGWNGQAGSTGYGGSAYMYNPECKTRFAATECSSPKLVRHTEEFNAAFNASNYGAVKGAFEAGKVDNVYSTFEASGKKWLVLNMELWPRTAVVDWSKQVVASHPDHNVIVQTHSYLEGNGEISGSNGGYGANSPRYVYDNLIKVYPNIKMVLSGHTGGYASRTDVGVNGNKIVSLLQTMHAGGTATPLRELAFDVNANTVTTKMIDVSNNTTYSNSTVTATGMNWK